MARISHCFRFSYIVAAIALTLIGCGAAQAAAAPKRAVHHARHAKKVVHHHAKAKVVHHAKAAHRVVSAAPIAVPVPVPAAAQQAAPAAPTTCADGDLVPASANLDRVRAATLCLIGMARAANGVPQLRETADLDAAAQAHTEDMVARDYFGHVGPTGLDLLDRIVGAGYAAVSNVIGAGENIAAASDSLATPAATVAGWMASPEHRANILDPSFTDTGLGVVASLPSSLGIGSIGATYTQCFGAK